MTVTSPHSREVAKEVRAQMFAQNKRLKHLAEVIGRSENTARARLQAVSPFDFDELMAICTWLNIPLSHLHREETTGQQVSNAS